MTNDEVRDAAARKADVLAALAAPATDVWVATSSADGVAHLVPLTLAWTGERVVLSVQETSLTGRNLSATGRARLAVGPTRDVVLIDAEVERRVPVDDDPPLGAAYADQADWDPRGQPGYVLVVLRPVRIQAWRSADEARGRTLMRGGDWTI